MDIDVHVIAPKLAETLNKGIFYREIFEFDNYSPIPVETEEEYKLVVSRFPFHDLETEKVKSLNNIALQSSTSQNFHCFFFTFSQFIAKIKI